MQSQSTTEWLPVDFLQVDPSYNRPINESRVNAMVRDFDPDAVGVIYVSRRRNGGLFVLDGQHRVATMRQLGWFDQKVPCLVFTNLTIEQEARLFREMNEQRTKPQPIDLFRSRLVEGEPMALAINSVVEKHGLKIARGPRENNIRAIRTFEVIAHNLGIKVLDDILTIIVDAWGRERDGLEQGPVTGLALLLGTHPHADKKRLIEKLREEHPAALTAKMKYLKNVAGNDNPTNFANLVIGLYNKGLRSNRLAEIKKRPNARNVLSGPEHIREGVRRVSPRKAKR